MKLSFVKLFFLSVFVFFSCGQKAFALGKPVHDATSNANIIKNLETTRQQLDQLQSQVREVQRLSAAIQNPQQAAGSMLGDITSPIRSDMYRIQGLQNDIQSIVNPPRSGASSLPMMRFGQIQSSTQFVKSNFMASEQPNQNIVPRQQIQQMTKRRQKLHQESVVSGTAIAMSEKESIENDLKNLEKLADQIKQSKDLRTDMQVNSQLQVEQIRQIIHLRVVETALLESVSTMMLGGVD